MKAVSLDTLRELDQLRQRLVRGESCGFIFAERTNSGTINCVAAGVLAQSRSDAQQAAAHLAVAVRDLTPEPSAAEVAPPPRNSFVLLDQGICLARKPI
jgi:DNA-binding IclR family transcriptional regulator